MLKIRLEKVIKELRTYLNEDGEDLELTDVDEEKGVVKVRLKGASVHYHKSLITLQLEVEEFLRKKIPEITWVEALP